MTAEESVADSSVEKVESVTQEDSVLEDSTINRVKRKCKYKPRNVQLSTCIQALEICRLPVFDIFKMLASVSVASNISIFTE